MKQAVILAGGKGTRLASVLGGLPKPLADVGGTPLLGHQLNLLMRHGFEEAVLLVSHGADHIATWLATHPPGIRVRLVDDGTPRGTAGAVLAALDTLEDDFLVLYADTMVWVDLTRFVNWHHADPEAAASLFLHPNDHPADSDLLELDATERVLRIHPYPHPDGTFLPNLVNAALYVVRREALRPWADATPPLDFAKDLFPRMLQAGLVLRGYNSPEYIKDAGTPSRLEKVRKAWADGAIARASLETPQRAVLIDRDGTLNHESGHVTRAEDLHVYDFAGPALRRLNDSEWRTVLVTNQPVLARGDTSDAELRRIHARLDTELARDGAYLDRAYVCPHHPDKGFPGEVTALKIACDCRKPEPGLILRAASELNLDLRESWFVGDSSADLGAAERAGVTSILVETGSGGLDGRYPFEPGFTVPNFAAAVDLVLDGYPRLAAQAVPLLVAMAAGQNWFVGGLARAGKSSFAATLVRELRHRNVRAHVVHLDRWIRSSPDREPGVLGRFDMPGLEAAARQAMTRTAGQTRLELPFYHRRRKERVEAAYEIELMPRDVVIWEGVVAIELARRLGCLSHSIHVDTAEPARAKRFAAYDQRRGVDAALSATAFAEREQDEHPLVLELAMLAGFRICLDTAFTQDNRTTR